MNTYRIFWNFIGIIGTIGVLSACQDKFLDAKPDQSLVIPTSIDDFQALLNNTSLMNASCGNMGEIGADDYYVTADRYQALSSTVERNTYVWNADIYASDQNFFDWKLYYQQVFTANTVLDGLKKIDQTENNNNTYQNLKGSALFFRSWAFYQLAQLFCKPYNEAAASEDLGIPLRLEADISIQSKRATVQQTYDQVIADLKASSALLAETPTLKTKPSKTAALALLAKVYLTMGDYRQALLYADSCLSYPHTWMDYNTLDLDKQYPIEQYNEEVIFHSNMRYAVILTSSRLNVDSTLYKSYDANDIRKNAFFFDKAGVMTFRGSYNGSDTRFNGIAYDEVLFIAAEALARLGHTDEALDRLNGLLEKRYTTGTFHKLSATADQVLSIILQERRKELVFRGIRWADLRRLNMDKATQTTLYRKLDDQEFVLEPGSKRYVLPIPNVVIEQSGMEQNLR